MERFEPYDIPSEMNIAKVQPGFVYLFEIKGQYSKKNCVPIAGGILSERNYRAAVGSPGQQGLGATGGHQNTTQARRDPSPLLSHITLRFFTSVLFIKGLS